MDEALLSICKEHLRVFYNQPNAKKLDEFALELAQEIETIRPIPVKAAPEFNTPHHNNTESEKHYKDNKKHFGKQCRYLYNVLMSGKRLTNFEMQTKHFVDGKRIACGWKRIAEMVDYGIFITREMQNTEAVEVAGFEVQKSVSSHKVYFMTDEQIMINAKEHGATMVVNPKKKAA